MNIPYIIAGGSGLVGTALCTLLQKMGHTVYVLTTNRNLTHNTEGIPYIYWDTLQQKIDSTYLFDACYLVNLAGAGVADKRWTAQRKNEIVQSRIASLDTLYKAISIGQLKPLHLVSASAIGFYGEGDSQAFEEDAPPANDFLGQTCVAWENAAIKIEKNFSIPLSILRIGLVMSSGGGAFPKLTQSIPFGIAPIPGSGKQIYSWIHIEDLCRMIVFSVKHQLKGIYNAVAPQPCSVTDIMREAVRNKGNKAITLKVPELIIKILLGEMAVEILKSCRVGSSLIQKQGFQFDFPDISTCVKNL